MHAFLEWFCDCRSGGMVRIGPEAFKDGDDYEFSVGFRIKDGVATLTGTHAPKNGIIPAYESAATSALNREGYREVRMERLKPHPDPALAALGVKRKRTIVMSKIPSVNRAIESDSGPAKLAAAPQKGIHINAKIAATDMRVAADAIEAGEVALVNGGQADSKNAGVTELARIAEAVAGMQTDQTLIWGLRDNNPKN